MENELNSFLQATSLSKMSGGQDVHMTVLSTGPVTCQTTLKDHKGHGLTGFWSRIVVRDAHPGRKALGDPGHFPIYSLYSFLP